MAFAKIRIYFKTDVLDPQGTAIKGALTNLGFNEVNDVRVSKLIEIKMGTKDKAEAGEQVKKMCDLLLVNSVIENYEFEILED